MVLLCALLVNAGAQETQSRSAPAMAASGRIRTTALAVARMGSVSSQSVPVDKGSVKGTPYIHVMDVIGSEARHVSADARMGNASRRSAPVGRGSAKEIRFMSVTDVIGDEISHVSVVALMDTAYLPNVL